MSLFERNLDAFNLPVIELEECWDFASPVWALYGR
jgi:hypothetical protein